MRILVADDAPVNRVALTSLLKKQGHAVVTAENGQEAVDLFDREQPEMVIMDIMMPHMDGYDATRLIKSKAKERFIPVIFVTAMSDEESLVHCVKHGGDDFLTKPYNPLILKAKIDALTRIRELYALVQSQNEDLRKYRDQLTREQELASSVLMRILHSGALHQSHLKFWLSPAAIMNGDLLLVARTPAGSLHVLLGDFTGHGLSAAICALPAAQVFYDMSALGYPISDVAAGINRKLKDVLPSHLFCAACLIELDSSGQRLTVWNGGSPDVLVWRHSQGVFRRFPSDHLPLGVVNPEFFGGSVAVTELLPTDRVYLYTDGLIEATDADGGMFEQASLESCLEQLADPESLFESIRERVTAFCGEAPLHDDIALVEIASAPLPTLEEESKGWSVGRPALPARVQAALEFDSAGLRRGDMMPTLMPLLNSLHVGPNHRESIHVILKELLSNALEHGVLQLDSTLKNSVEGFGAYYEKREQTLTSLESGWIKIELVQEYTGSTGSLTIRVEDSGAGFDHTSERPGLSENTRPWARGIPLVRSLCREVVYRGNGNLVEAVYAW